MASTSIVSQTHTPGEQERAHRDRALLVARFYYFAFFGALAAIVSFFNVYLQERGLSGTEIGLISSIPTFVALLANPVWGAIADRWEAHQRVMALLAVCAGTISFAFIWVDRFWTILIALSLLVFFRSPIPSILDATVMGFVARHEDVSYGRLRVFGSIGWILLSFSAGILVGRGLLYTTFWLHALFLAIFCAILSLYLPVQKSSGRVDYVEGLRKLAGTRTYLGLLFFMTLFGAATAAQANFASLNLLRLGGTAAFVGLTTASSGFLEIPVMFAGGRWVRLMGYRKSILLGGAGCTAIWLMLSFATRPWHVLAATSGIGLFAGLLWMAVVGFANDSAPDGLRATSQAVAQAAFSGMGWALGSALSGVLWDWGSGPAVFAGATILMAMGVAIFALGTRALQPARAA